MLEIKSVRHLIAGPMFLNWAASWILWAGFLGLQGLSTRERT